MLHSVAYFSIWLQNHQHNHSSEIVRGTWLWIVFCKNVLYSIFRNDADANYTIPVKWNSRRPLFYMMTSSSYSYFTIIVFHRSILTFVFPPIKQRLEKIWKQALARTKIRTRPCQGGNLNTGLWAPTKLVSESFLSCSQTESRPAWSAPIGAALFFYPSEP